MGKPARHRLVNGQAEQPAIGAELDTDVAVGVDGVGAQCGQPVQDGRQLVVGGRQFGLAVFDLGGVVELVEPGHVRSSFNGANVIRRIIGPRGGGHRRRRPSESARVREASAAAAVRSGTLPVTGSVCGCGGVTTFLSAGTLSAPSPPPWPCGIIPPIGMPIGIPPIALPPAGAGVVGGGAAPAGTVGGVCDVDGVTGGPSAPAGWVSPPAAAATAARRRRPWLWPARRG